MKHCIRAGLLLSGLAPFFSLSQSSVHTSEIPRPEETLASEPQLTLERLKKIHQSLTQNPLFRMQDEGNLCHERSPLIRDALAKQGVSSQELSIACGLMNHMVLKDPGSGRTVAFFSHVVPSVTIGGIQYVMDIQFFDEPVPLDQYLWLVAQAKPPFPESLPDGAFEQRKSGCSVVVSQSKPVLSILNANQKRDSEQTIRDFLKTVAHNPSNTKLDGLTASPKEDVLLAQELRSLDHLKKSSDEFKLAINFRREILKNLADGQAKNLWHILGCPEGAGDWGRISRADIEKALKVAFPMDDEKLTLLIKEKLRESYVPFVRVKELYPGLLLSMDRSLWMSDGIDEDFIALFKQSPQKGSAKLGVEECVTRQKHEIKVFSIIVSELDVEIRRRTALVSQKNRLR